MSENTSEKNPFIKIGDTYVNKNNIAQYVVKYGCVNITYRTTHAVFEHFSPPNHPKVQVQDTAQFCGSSEVLQKFLKSLNPKHGE